MAADLIAEVEKAYPCDNAEMGCYNGRHTLGCNTRHRPAVLALVREQVAARDAEWRLSIPVADADAPMTPENAREQITIAIKACEQLAAKKAAAAARRPLVEALTECADAMAAIIVMMRNDMGGDEANGMQRFNSRTFAERTERALKLLAAEKKGGTG